jgi:glycosyltransferase involved in cell wall biosynthesis
MSTDPLEAIEARWMSRKKCYTTVCCVMLTRDRPEFARQAVEAFRAQTYANKTLLIYDTGESSVYDLSDSIGIGLDDEDVIILESQARNHHKEMKTIGYLRNRANAGASSATDIIIHWDDDDWSHPQRIAEQVELLKFHTRVTAADCVGYREMLFWHTLNSEAWLYTNNDPRYCLGTSMCYWRSAWERRPFPDRNRREDEEWRKGISSLGVSCAPGDFMSRMIARIHAGNVAQYQVEQWAKTGPNWRRAPQWDDYCRSKLG